MVVNKGILAGKTAFISGASRGIGKAIALKFAKDGANIVIAAKSATPHAKLPGTIYTVAAEIEAAGGRALPCIVDVRDDVSVQDSVDAAVKEFGGIDILVNNASAISLTGTLATSMKKYDLMNSVNTRGTYLCSQVCLPHLKKSAHGHILNISPPLSMNPLWFKNHTAYTIAKYGMSMCVLGMAEEFRDDGVSVNGLWPRTTIATAAVEMLGGEDLIAMSRKPEIMADAAYAIVTRNDFTGNLTVDDDVLRAAGVTDLEGYSWVPGNELAPDYFLDEALEHFTSKPMKAKKQAAPAAAASGSTEAIFDKISGVLNEEMCSKVKSVFKFELTGDESGEWIVDIQNGAGSVGRASPGSPEASCTMVMESGDFAKMFKGELNSMQAFMSGKLKIKGDMAQAMKLEKLMKSVQSM